MTAIAPTGPRAQGVRWDLSRIVTDAAAARRLADETRAACDAFAERYAAASPSSTPPAWPRR